MSRKSYKDEPTWKGKTIFANKMNIYIPLKLQLVCNKIAKQVGNNEFSIFCKIEKIEGTNIYLSDFYTIPEQRVSGAFIDYGKDPDEYVDTVIHRHPDGLNNFSGTDDAYINQNFKCSLLYTKSGGFVHGIYNMDMGENVKLRVEVNPLVDDGLGDIDISNIKFNTYPNYFKNTYKYEYPYGYEYENEYGYPYYGSRIREWKNGEEITPFSDTNTTNTTNTDIISKDYQLEIPYDENKTKTENMSTIDKLRAKWAKEEKEEKKKKHAASPLITHNEELKAFETFKKDYDEELFNIKDELLVNNFSDAEVNDGKLLELILNLKEKVDSLESYYDDSLMGLNEEVKFLDERLSEVEEIIEGVEFKEIDDKKSNGKNKKK